MQSLKDICLHFVDLTSCLEAGLAEVFAQHTVAAKAFASLRGAVKTTIAAPQPKLVAGNLLLLAIDRTREACSLLIEIVERCMGALDVAIEVIAPSIGRASSTDPLDTRPRAG